jgi:hypothetical protein
MKQSGWLPARLEVRDLGLIIVVIAVVLAIGRAIWQAAR